MNEMPICQCSFQLIGQNDCQYDSITCESKINTPFKVVHGLFASAGEAVNNSCWKTLFVLVEDL
jgi:hypothetical protein